MNAFWAPENFDAFVALGSSSREIKAENSSQKRSSLAGSKFGNPAAQTNNVSRPQVNYMSVHMATPAWER